MLTDLWQWIYDLSIVAAVRDSQWAFPILESIHIYSMIFLIVLLATFDMRLMGITIGDGKRSILMSDFSRIILRWMWIPLLLNAATGTLLFATRAPEYSGNWAFVTKMALILVGVLYHLIVILKAARWREAFVPTVRMKIVSCFSILLWVGVIVASRWIAYA